MKFSEAPFLFVAAGLHGALLLAALVAPAAAVENVAAPIEVDVEVEIEDTRPAPQIEAPAARVETPSPSPTVEPPTARSDARLPSAGVIEPGPAPTTAPSTEPQIAPVPGPAPSATSEYGGPPPSVPGVGGPGVIAGLPGMGGPAWAIPGTIPDMGKPAPAPTTSPRATVDPQIATKVIKDAMLEKDKALGLDLPAAGTVASSVKAAVQATDTPPESRATFEIRLSPTGQVLSVRVTSSSGGTSDQWSRAAAAAQAALAGRTLAMTSNFAKGAVVHVNVQSTTTLPDGSKSAIERKGAGATFDLANIGAHMQRVVRTSFSVVAVK